MSPALGSKWSNYSKDLVYKIWSKSPAKLARLQNYRRDARSQIHGELCFVGFKRELNINRILINGGHGEYFENLYISDLQAIKTVRQIGPKFTSICGPGNHFHEIFLIGLFSILNLNILKRTPQKIHEIYSSNFRSFLFFIFFIWLALL